MGLRRYKPTTAHSTRLVISPELAPGICTGKEPAAAKVKTGGREHQCAASHRGGGHKQQYRLIDFRRNKDGVPAHVHSVDLIQTASAAVGALLHYVDGEKRYVIAATGLKRHFPMPSSTNEQHRSVSNCLPNGDSVWV